MANDRNGAPVTSIDWSLTEKKTVVFDGGTTNDPGDQDGTGNPTTLFTVTGPVLMKCIAFCSDALVGASATIRVGTAISNTGLIASTTAANLIANEIWHDATPDASIELASVATTKIVNQDVILTVGTANITAGEMTVYCSWFPLHNDAKVVAA